MNLDAFRCMRRGAQLFTLNQEDSFLLSPVFQQNSPKRQKALLLLHGFSSTPAVFRYLLPSLTMYDAIYCPALAGHSQDIDSLAKTKASDWLSQAEQDFTRLNQEFAEIDVMGLSLGGLLAAHLSTRFRLHHLYLLAPAFDLNLALGRSLYLAKILTRLGFSRIRSGAGNLFHPQHCEIAYRQIPITAIIEILTLIQNFHLALPSCSTDVFLGRHDKVIAPLSVAQRFSSQQNIKVHWLEQSAHVLPLDKDLSQILACLEQNHR